MKILELFCGTKSFSNVAEANGHETFTTDIDKKFKPDYLVNIFQFDVKKVPFQPDLIWASPDCTYFSCAAGSKHFDRYNNPKHLKASQSLKMIQITIDIIEYFSPKLWYIENPQGKLHKMKMLNNDLKKTLTYCQYGDKRRKPTNVWTNNHHWQPRPICDLQDSCHPEQTMNRSTAKQRAIIPPLLCQEIVNSSKEYLDKYAKLRIESSVFTSPRAIENSV